MRREAEPASFRPASLRTTALRTAALRATSLRPTSLISAPIVPDADDPLLLQPLTDEHTQVQDIEAKKIIESARQLTPYLLHYLKTHTDDLPHLRWDVFEQLVAECLASRGFDEVRLVGQDSQTAADIFAIQRMDSSGARIRHFVEVKRWKDRVGIEVIDRVYGAMLGERPTWGWHLAMIVSIAGFKDTRKYTRQELEYKGIELRNRDDVVDWLNDYRPSDKGLWIRGRPLDDIDAGKSKGA